MSLDSLIKQINGDKDMIYESWFPDYAEYVTSLLDTQTKGTGNKPHFVERGYLKRRDPVRLYSRRGKRW